MSRNITDIFLSENIFPLFLPTSLCRWSIRPVPGVGRSRPVHIWYLFLCSAAPQDPPPETGAQRYRVPICLSFSLWMCFFFLFSSLCQSCSVMSRILAIACPLPLCEASQRRQAVSLDSTALHHWARTGHLTHIGPLFCLHHPAANLTGLSAGRTFRGNFVDE